MPVKIAILRGINVSGQKKILMADLKLLFANLGFTKIQTYIQSGNVLFECEEPDKDILQKQIEDAIYRQYGFTVPVLVKEDKELEHLLESNPFLTPKYDPDISKLHVTLLSGIPDSELYNQIDPKNYLPDEFIISENVIYLHCPNGYGRTKLSNNFIESKLKVTATTRNWKTVIQLVSMAKSNPVT